MIARLNGDYSKFPQAIRGTFPYVAGSACELHQFWTVYHRLFMEDRSHTELMGKALGGILGIFQTALQESMLLTIARLTDKDNRAQRNLSVWSLREAVPFANDPSFSAKVDTALNELVLIAANIRKHRHKRLAHYDLDVSLKTQQLPTITFPEIKSFMEKLEGYVNLFFWEFEQTTMPFGMLRTDDVTASAEACVLKARVYDKLEIAGIIPRGEWLKDRPA